MPIALAVSMLFAISTEVLIANGPDLAMCPLWTILLAKRQMTEPKAKGPFPIGKSPL